jgi:hypothetical protein
MSEMVRKQVNITQRQAAFLKRLAKRRGISEAEVVRQAIDREGAAEEIQPDESAASALDDLLKSALERREHGLTDEPYQWRREDAYERRLGQNSEHASEDTPQG